MRFFDLEVHIHIIERLVTSLVIGSLVIRASSHDGWNFSFIARANNIDLDQIWKTILVAINSTFYIDHFTDHIMARKGCEALAVKIVILVIFRNQAIADQLIDE